jgi:lipoate-protein ligase A
VRLVVHEPSEAAWNMAVDEALLVAGVEPTLRLYGWSPHAVSLGYFQRIEHFRDLPPDTPVVRRLTGGGAIHHGDEITFSLTVDAASLPRDIEASYRLLHDAAVGALAAAGVASRRLQAGPAASSRPTDRWCFAQPGCHDVVTDRGKLLGSAQRRIRLPRARVLHHGSIVLNRPELTPFVGATADATACTAAFAQRLRDLLGLHISRALGVDLRPGALTTAEDALATQLCSERYRDLAFVQRS